MATVLNPKPQPRERKVSGEGEVPKSDKPLSEAEIADWVATLSGDERAKLAKAILTEVDDDEG